MIILDLGAHRAAKWLISLFPSSFRADQVGLLNASSCTERSIKFWIILSASRAASRQSAIPRQRQAAADGDDMILDAQRASTPSAAS